MDEVAWFVLLVGTLLLAAIGTKELLQRARVPALIGHLLLGVAVGAADQRWQILGDFGRHALLLLEELGVIVLLFRVGLESDLPALLGQLPRAIFVWVSNVFVSGAFGFAAARWGLGLDLVPSLLVATALTATSMGVSMTVWREAGALRTPIAGELVDVAELDDISAVALMGIVLAVVPVLLAGGAVGGTAAWTMVSFVVRFGLFTLLCVVFSRWAEETISRGLLRARSAPDPLLLLLALGLIVAATAEIFGLSFAIGALFAGLVFSRDPEAVRLDASFDTLYELFVPFFFIGIGIGLDVTALEGALPAGGVLLLVAVLGKVVGGALPHVAVGSWRDGLLVGTSLVPRAEIAMVVMLRARQLGAELVPPEVYGAMVIVSAGTCLIAPLALRQLLYRQSG